MNGIMNDIVVSFGGNQPETPLCFEEASHHLEEKLGKIIKKSSLYQSKAWGFEKPTADFLNQIIILSSCIKPAEVLDITQNIEKKLGRESKSTNGKYKDRPIDIDILFYADKIVETERLKIPHYLIEKRKFILEPLNEIIPDFMHPILKKTIKELLLLCKDNSEVKIRKELK